ncbi:MAG: glycosyltransferase [Verrucomicrobiota bacterium]
MTQQPRPRETTEAGTLSFVMAARDEDKTLRPLFDEMLEAMRSYEGRWECVLIDDGSRDGTWGEMLELAEDFPDYVRVFRLDESVGKNPALAFGLREAKGEMLITLDADLQDDPAMTSRFLDRMKGDFDVVTGWRIDRQDGLGKRLCSALYNKLANFLGRNSLHDRNCGMRCFKRDLFERREDLIPMHQHIASLGDMLGIRVSEVEILHRPRRFGRNQRKPLLLWNRLRKLVGLYFLRGNSDRPGPFFSWSAVSCLSMAGVLAGIGVVGLVPALTPVVAYSVACGFAGAGLFSALFALFGVACAERIRRGGRPVSIAATGGIGLIAEQEAMVLPPERESSAASGSADVPMTKRALVADDDPAILRLMEQVLEGEGWEVKTAATLREAIEGLDSSTHVAFLDVHMPEANSIEVIELMRQRSPGTRYVSFTGDRNAQLGAEAFRRGASDFLRKPIQFEEVIRAANAAFGEDDRARDTSVPAFSE